MILAHLPVLQVVLPLTAAMICVLLPRQCSKWIATIVGALGLCISYSLYQQVQLEGSISYLLGNWAVPWGIEYYVDSLTVYLLMIINSLGFLVILASTSLVQDIKDEHIGVFYAAFLLNLTGLLGIILTNDAFNLFVFIEISSLSTYTLISLNAQKKPACYAAFQYLIFGTLGASFILISVGLLYVLTGTLNMSDIYMRLPDLEGSQTLNTAFIFFIVGVGLKLAMFPLHVWLPHAYQYAPSVVSVFLAATGTKVFVYVLIRFTYSVFGEDFFLLQEIARYVLIIGALFAMLYGSVKAVMSDSLKRLLAYSSIAQISYIIVGILLFSRLGLSAGLIHLLNHAVIKASLFLAVGIIIQRYQTDSLAQLSGVAKSMPIVVAALLIAGLGLVGMPLSAGFISKWYLFYAAFDSGHFGIIIFLAFSSVLTMIYVWKIVEACYLKSDHSLVPVASYVRPYSAYIALFVLTAANIYLGIDTTFSADFAQDIAQNLIAP